MLYHVSTEYGMKVLESVLCTAGGGATACCLTNIEHLSIHTSTLIPLLPSLMLLA